MADAARADSLPFLTAPHDALRKGLATLKDEAATVHPVDAIQRARVGAGAADPERLRMLQNVYGTALPARMHLEQQILGRVQRLPGLPSSRLGAEALSGELDEFSFDSYLGRPEDADELPPDLHSAMEARLGLDKGPAGTKPMSRGVF